MESSKKAQSDILQEIQRRLRGYLQTPLSPEQVQQLRIILGYLLRTKFQAVDNLPEIVSILNQLKSAIPDSALPQFTASKLLLDIQKNQQQTIQTNQQQTIQTNQQQTIQNNQQQTIQKNQQQTIQQSNNQRILSAIQVIDNIVKQKYPDPKYNDFIHEVLSDSVRDIQKEIEQRINLYIARERLQYFDQDSLRQLVSDLNYLQEKIPGALSQINVYKIPQLELLIKRVINGRQDDLEITLKSLIRLGKAFFDKYKFDQQKPLHRQQMKTEAENLNKLALQGIQPENVEKAQIVSMVYGMLSEAFTSTSNYVAEMIREFDRSLELCIRRQFGELSSVNTHLMESRGMGIGFYEKQIHRIKDMYILPQNMNMLQTIRTELDNFYTQDPAQKNLLQIIDDKIRLTVERFNNTLGQIRKYISDIRQKFSFEHGDSYRTSSQEIVKIFMKFLGQIPFCDANLSNLMSFNRFLFQLDDVFDEKDIYKAPMNKIREQAMQRKCTSHRAEPNDLDYCHMREQYCHRKSSILDKPALDNRYDCAPDSKQENYGISQECVQFLDELVVRYKLFGKHGQLPKKIADMKWGKNLKSAIETLEKRKEEGTIQERVAIFIKAIFPKTVPYGQLSSDDVGVFLFPTQPTDRAHLNPGVCFGDAVEENKKSYKVDSSAAYKLIQRIPWYAVHMSDKNGLLEALQQLTEAQTQQKTTVGMDKKKSREIYAQMSKQFSENRKWYCDYQRVITDLNLGIYKENVPDSDVWQQRNFAGLIYAIEKDNRAYIGDNFIFQWIYSLFKQTVDEYGAGARELFVSLLSLKLIQMFPMIPDLNFITSEYLTAIDTLKLQESMNKLPYYNAIYQTDYGAYCQEHAAYIMSRTLIEISKKPNTFLQQLGGTDGSETDQQKFEKVLGFLLSKIDDIKNRGLLQYKNDVSRDIKSKPSNFLKLVLLFTDDRAGDSHEQHMLTILSDLQNLNDDELFDRVKNRFQHIQLQNSGIIYTIIFNGSLVSFEINLGHSKVTHSSENNKIIYYTSIIDNRAIEILEKIYFVVLEKHANLTNMRVQCAKNSSYDDIVNDMGCDSPGMYYMRSRSDFQKFQTQPNSDIEKEYYNKIDEAYSDLKKLSYSVLGRLDHMGYSSLPKNTLTTIGIDYRNQEQVDVKSRMMDISKEIGIKMHELRYLVKNIKEHTTEEFLDSGRALLYDLQPFATADYMDIEHIQGLFKKIKQLGGFLALHQYQ